MVKSTHTNGVATTGRTNGGQGRRSAGPTGNARVYQAGRDQIFHERCPGDRPGSSAPAAAARPAKYAVCLRIPGRR